MYYFNSLMKKVNCNARSGNEILIVKSQRSEANVKFGFNKF